MRKYHYLILLLTSFLSIQGCVLVAAGAGAAGSAVVVNDKRPLQTMADDKNIEITANTNISKDSAMNTNSHIDVVAFNHAVLLAGQVPEESVKDQVESMIEALPKVTRVYNELVVAPPTSAETWSRDTFITTEVKSKMLTTKNLNSGQIKVVTEDGTVYLMGIVTHKQADTAADVARRIDGVKRVVTLFEYTM